jgi:hypothetical protein
MLASSRLGQHVSLLGPACVLGHAVTVCVELNAVVAGKQLHLKTS